jgi:hypothetical protein
MSMKNSSYTTGNRTRDHPAGSAVPRPTASPRVPLQGMSDIKFAYVLLHVSSLSVQTIGTVANKPHEIKAPNTPQPIRNISTRTL